MSEEEVVWFCAPTLAGIKTGSLFNTVFSDHKQEVDEICRLNQKLVPKGMRALPLGTCRGRLLLYVYRPARLEKDLSEKRCWEVLKALGYEEHSCDQCVIHLIERVRESKEFPHEIGFFLGYPAEDVIYFMENKEGRKHHNPQYIGMWQAYANAEEAEKTDKQYHRCTAYCMDAIKNGRSMDQLLYADPEK